MKIQIIVGTTRQGRFSEKAASYILQEAKKRKEFDVELVDLRDYPMPFFEEPISPKMFEMTHHAYTNEVVKKWLAKISEADGYIIVTAEYNHGYPAVLKNAIDFGYKEWIRKSVGFVSYGNSGGARSVEQLRQVVIELDMIPIRTAIQIPFDVYMAVRNETVPVNPELFAPLRKGPVDRVEAFFTDLIWTTKALVAARK
ncbi:MAG TPA: NAD(P)H-dependent oxidoreductase [Patescibacteria group bacterium]|nr:NAD(P)H-dependent oxidoreductase [Patescibacteria group bacterium]